MAKSRWARLRRRAMIAVPILAAGYFALVFMPLSPVPLELSEQTTYLTGPLRPDGTVDYAAALNERNSEGVTPQNNAAIVMLRAFGPDALPPEPVRGRMYELLGIEPLPEDGEYFVTLRAFLEAGGEVEPNIWRRYIPALEQTWTAEQYPDLARWLRANERPLAMLGAVREAPRFFSPIVPPPESPHLMAALAPLLHHAREASNALAARALLDDEARTAADDWQDIDTIHLIADRLADQDNFLYGHRAAVTIRHFASYKTLIVLREHPPGREIAAESLARMLAAPPLRGLSHTINVERLLALDTAQSMYRESKDRTLLPGDPLDLNLMMRPLNAVYDDLEAAASAPTVAARLELMERFDERRIMSEEEWARAESAIAHEGLVGFVPAPVRRRVVSEAVGETLTQTLARSEPGVVKMTAAAEAQYEVTKGALALHLHQLDHGEYPDALAALVPHYLPDVPLDPFADAPLTYRRESGGYVLYSIGRDFTDGGGGVDDRDPERPRFDDPHDIVFRIRGE